jgi:uncharacterized protein YidB (DUF937 family)
VETIMGLMDILRGMQYGPRGQPAPRTGTGSGTGTGTGSTGIGGTGLSPLTMAILGLLAYKAVKSLRHEQPEMTPAGDVKQVSAPETSGDQSGGVGGLLKGAFGGLLAGSAGGGILGSGVNDLLKQLQKQGFGDTADSWVGHGPNKTITPGDLAKALGPDQLEAMMQHSGLSREELLDGLSKHLPEIIDRLTPEGQIPRHIPM